MIKAIDPFNKINAEDFVTRGKKVYQKVKAQYEPKYKGMYVAIEPDSQQVYLGKDGADAMTKAQKSQPNKVFYVVKIGYAAAETIARSYLQ